MSPLSGDPVQEQGMPRSVPQQHAAMNDPTECSTPGAQKGGAGLSFFMEFGDLPQLDSLGQEWLQGMLC